MFKVITSSITSLLSIVSIELKRWEFESTNEFVKYVKEEGEEITAEDIAEVKKKLQEHNELKKQLYK